MIRPAEALAFGIGLGAAAIALLGLLADWFPAALAAAAIPLYVLVYTMGLKRRTAANIVIGGAAGCFPVLVGWSAVTGTVGLHAVILFAVIFFLDAAALLGARHESSRTTTPPPGCQCCPRSHPRPWSPARSSPTPG